jgi:predicted Zn-dependent protease
MKVLIGYDGSPSANQALEELKRAGLPAATKVLIVTVSDVWMPPPNIELYQAALASRRAAGTMAQLQNLRRAKNLLRAV